LNTERLEVASERLQNQSLSLPKLQRVVATCKDIYKRVAAAELLQQRLHSDQLDYNLHLWAWDQSRKTRSKALRSILDDISSDALEASAPVTRFVRGESTNRYPFKAGL
jgi:hypothetical protein